MKLLSIDIGIKNLSICLFDVNNNDYKILDWDILNLTELTPKVCQCGKPAKYKIRDNYYCNKHSKQTNFINPDNIIGLNKIKKYSLEKLTNFHNDYINTDITLNKNQLMSSIETFFENNVFSLIEKINASKIDLITLGRNLQIMFDSKEVFNNIDRVIIENQIGPIANRMKTIQGMVVQYFIIKNNKIEINLVSSSNKLKLTEEIIETIDIKNELKKEKLTYAERKQEGIKKCIFYLINQDTKWSNLFNLYSKKDDLSDCFLQGIWFIKNKMQN